MEKLYQPTHNEEDLLVPKHFSKWRRKLNEIIFGYHTLAGKVFDIVVLLLIFLSIVLIMLESVSFIVETHGSMLKNLEWVFTFLFTLEYLARLSSHPKPLKYALSFMGLVDLFSIIPTYLGIFITGSHSSLMVIRAFRLVRVFRILKLTRYIGGANAISKALWNSRYKIVVFLGYVMCVVVIVGTLLYVIEGGKNGFSSIPRSVYWAIVTITTVGYGDIAPQTILGQTLSSILMITGYAIIVVPTGFVTGELMKEKKLGRAQQCLRCKAVIEIEKANYCFVCGESLDN